MNGDIELGRREPGHGHGQPIGVVTGLFDVVGRVTERGAVDAGRRIDQAKHPVETDRRTEQRREIETIHNHILH